MEKGQSLHEPKELERTAQWPRGRHASIHSKFLHVCIECESKTNKQQPTEDAATNQRQSFWPRSKPPGAQRVGGSSHSCQLMGLTQIGMGDMRQR